MSHYLIEQFRFVRRSTLDYVSRIDGHRMEAVPTGLNNNIKWNLGHIYMSSEKIIFQLAGEQASIPEKFVSYFGMGTSPASWSDEPPTKEELIDLLEQQLIKVEKRMEPRIGESLQEVYRTSAGLRISSVAECISFCLYHEGMHFAAIKSIHQQVQSEQA